MGFGAGSVEIPSNLLISSGCLGLSGLNLTDVEGGGGGGDLRRLSSGASPVGPKGPWGSCARSWSARRLKVILKQSN